MQFKIEQIAFAPRIEHREKAIRLLVALGLTEWVTDFVEARGEVLGERDQENTAHLSFNYQAEPSGPLELEVLNYISGVNWIEDDVPIVSHVGMHVTEAELDRFTDILCGEFGVAVVQEVKTVSHTNPHIRDSRKYHYCIFGTRELIGTDLKFIVRRNHDGSEIEE